MILRTRLFKPLINRGYIQRKRLNETIDENWYKPFHLILAEAGYGKSILTSLTLDRLKVSYSWISLEPDCNNLRLFLVYLTEAINSKSISNESDLVQLTESLELPNFSSIKFTLFKVFEHIEDSHVLVFDDYHCIYNDEIHLLMNELIKSLPSRHKLIILSRHLPQLNFGRIGAFDQLHIIDMEQMKFFPNEIQDLSNQVFDTELDHGDAQLIYEYSMGWIVPIRLILRAHSKGCKLEQLISQMNFDNTELTGFMLEEVLNFETPKLKESLMLASLFERFSIEMISDIMSADNDLINHGNSNWDGNQLKEFISRSLFVNALDEKKKWYRLHDIVKIFLQSRADDHLSKERLDGAIDIGSNYLESFEFYEEAIRLNLVYKRVSKAVELVERYRHSYINNNRFDIIEQWLDLFPTEIVNRCPSLMVMQIYLDELSSNWEGMQFYCGRLKSYLSNTSTEPEKTDILWAEYYCFSSVIELFRGNKEIAIEGLDQALILVSKQQTYIHGFVLCFKSIALVSSNRTYEARIMLDEQIEKLDASDSILISQCLLAKSLIEFLEGNLNELRHTSTTILRMSDPVKNFTLRIFANYYIAFVNYMQDNLVNLESILNESLKLKHKTRPGWVIHLLYLKCLCYVAEHLESKLNNCLEEMVNFNSQLKSHDFSNDIRIMKCEIYLNAGDINSAWKIALSADFEKTVITHRYFCPRLTQIKLLILKGGSKYISMAERCIQEFEKESGVFRSKIVKLQLLALKTILYSKKNDKKRALEILKVLVQETEKEGIVRLYTNLGVSMKTLIIHLEEESEYWNLHLTQILSSFDLKDEFERMRKREIHQQEMIDIFKSMSATEVQIIKLISEGMRNKEIAHYLHYSVGTVKTYVYNIYKKIQAENRAKAILLYHEFKENIGSIND